MNTVSLIDFVIRIKNAGRAKRKVVSLPYSKICQAVGKVLATEGFLENIRTETDGNKKILIADIRYVRRQPAFSDMKIISKPSLRTYASLEDLRTIGRRGSASTIISTSRGIMTVKEAVKKGIGGEVLFEIL